MRRRAVRLLPWLVVAWLIALILARYQVTREVWEGFLPQLWLYGKGLGLALLLLVAALGIGYPLLKRLVRVEGGPKVPIFAAALGLGAISLLTLLVGLLGGLHAATAWAILGGGALLALLQVPQWRVWAQTVPWRQLTGGLSGFCTPFHAILAFVAIAGILYSVTANGFTPPLGWDEAAYHLALPKIYAAEHRIVNVPFILYSTQPFNTEMLFTLALLLRSEVMASLISLLFAGLLSAGLWLFARETLGQRTGFLAVALFWTTPAICQLTGSTFIEIPLATYTLLGLWAFWRWLQDDSVQRWLFLAALMAGLAAGTKLTGAVVAIILALLVAVQALRQRAPIRATAGRIALLAGVAFALALPWYAKSYSLTGNPVWPFVNSFFGGQYWDALGEEYHNGYLARTNLPPNLGSFVIAPWRVSVSPNEFGTFPLGLLPVGLAPLALAFGRKRAGPVYLLAGVTGLYYVAWFLMTHQTRFLVPMVPALCMLGGYALHRLLGSDRRAFRLLLKTLVAVIVLAQTPGIKPDVTKQWVTRLPYLVGLQSRGELLTAHSSATAAYVWANEHLPASAKVLLMPYENRGYFLDRDYAWANPISQRILKLEQFESGEALWQELRALGFTHLLDSPRTVIDDIRYWQQIEGLLQEVKDGFADPIYDRNGVAILELH
jgi:4-amino-4-deoxy-L-arabinose transferase-like glycosyltransferase